MTRVGMEAGGYGTLEVEAEGCQGAVVAPGTVSFPFTCTHQPTTNRPTDPSVSHGLHFTGRQHWSQLTTRLTDTANRGPHLPTLRLAPQISVSAGWPNSDSSSACTWPTDHIQIGQTSFSTSRPA